MGRGGESGEELFSHKRPSVLFAFGGLDVKKNAIETLVDEVLDGTAPIFASIIFNSRKTWRPKSVSIVMSTTTRPGKVTIEGHGVGIVDAFFQGIIGIYSQEFSFLRPFDSMTWRSKPPSTKAAGLAQ